MNTPKMLAIGAAVQDVFLSGKVFTPVKDGKNYVEELPLGAKLDVEGITFSTGGGATNASVTFARQGLESSFMGTVGHDPAGASILHDLDAENVHTGHVSYSDKYNTGYSALLLAPSGERTILTYRGASTHYEAKNFHLNAAEADWVYISSMAGCIDVVEAIVTQAKEKGIKVAINPGKGELKEVQKLKSLLEDVTILILNKDEIQQLVEGETSEDLARHAAHFVDYAIVTDGPNGVVAVGQNKVVKAGMYEDVPVIDRTGAGDAFGSGFTAAIALGKTIEEAVTFASANSTSVVSQIGAKAGILHADVELHDMPLESKPF